MVTIWREVPTASHKKKWGEINRGKDGMCNVWRLPGSGLGLGINDLGKKRWMDHWEQGVWRRSVGHAQGLGASVTGA